MVIQRVSVPDSWLAQPAPNSQTIKKAPVAPTLSCRLQEVRAAACTVRVTGLEYKACAGNAHGHGYMLSQRPWSAQLATNSQTS